MTFTSWQFGVFAAIVFAAYYLPALRAFQVQLLVFASLFFYGYGQPELLALLAVAVFGTYLFLVLALRNRQVWLPVGIAFNLALLAFFKYKLLFIDPASPSVVDFAPLDFLLKLPLPIGISFFVFHNISLLVDLTRQKAVPPTLSGVFLYIIFFPQLVSGPITRAEMFMPQIKPKYFADVPFVEAAKWILTGFFFKLYVANNLNEMTSYMSFPLYETLQTQDRWLLVFLYSYQIYADFFGYSGIAIGLVLLFGYRLPINFDLPYISSLRPARRQSPWPVADLFEPDDRDGIGRPLARRWPQLSDVGAAARPAAGARTPFVGATGFDRLCGVSSGADHRRLCLRHHALDFLQAAEFRSCGRLPHGHVCAEHESQPDQAVLQPGAALFAAGHGSAPWFASAVRGKASLGGAISLRLDGCADVSGGRPRNVVHLFSVLEHDPEKWVPVFRKDHAQIKEIERDDDSKKSHPALETRKKCLPFGG